MKEDQIRGKSTVKALFQLYIGNSECVQTGMCNAIILLLHGSKKKKKFNL